jgi:5-methylcytosine-specific restriction protein A
MPQAAKPYRNRKWNGDLQCRKYHKMYGKTAWVNLRISFLRDNPLCIECLNDGIYKMAKIVDHIIPHKGDTETFFDLRNLQSLCKKHHDKKTYLEMKCNEHISTRVSEYV